MDKCAAATGDTESDTTRGSEADCKPDVATRGKDGDNGVEEETAH